MGTHESTDGRSAGQLRARSQGETHDPNRHVRWLKAAQPEGMGSIANVYASSGWSKQCCITASDFRCAVTVSGVTYAISRSSEIKRKHLTRFLGMRSRMFIGKLSNSMSGRFLYAQCFPPSLSQRCSSAARSARTWQLPHRVLRLLLRYTEPKPRPQTSQVFVDRLQRQFKMPRTTLSVTA